MDGSVDSYINAQPETVMSADEYWQTYKNRPDFYGNPHNLMKAPEHYGDLNYKIAKFFGSGAENSFDSAYEAYVNNVNNRNESLAVQSARAYDKMMDDSRIQRTMADYQKAGLNPYLLLNGGTISAGNAGSSPKPDYNAKSKSKEKESNKTRDVALLLIALSRVAAALL